jgi:hypothetical protein
MIVDVTLNQLKKLFIAGSRLIRHEKGNLIYLYYVTQAPVIFRTILERPKDEGEYHLLILGLPQNIQALNVIEPSAVPILILQNLEDIGFKIDQLKELLRGKDE